MKLIYFIPIRSGSKGIPGKNMKLLGGKPLVAWILESIIASNTADEIWVATDDNNAADFIHNNYPEVNIFRRSSLSSTDTSPVIDVVMEFISSITFSDDDILILAQATSPFTSPKDFNSLCVCLNGQYDSYVSCERVKKFIWHDDGYPVSYNLDSKPRRQDYAGILLENGAFYASRIREIKQSQNLLSGHIKVVETHSISVELDEPNDWLIAESIINTNS